MFRKLLLFLVLASVLVGIGLTALVILSPNLAHTVGVARLASPISPPLATASPTSTPTPTATVTPAPPPTIGDTIDRDVTDASGRAVFQDPILHAPIGIRVADAVTNNPLANIATFVLSQGQELLIVAIDPSQRHLVAFQQATHKKLESFLPVGRKMAAPLGLANPDLYISMQPITSIKTPQDWLAVYGYAPDVDRWGMTTRDECVDADQIPTGIRKVAGTPIALLPFPAQVLTDTQNAPIADWAWLALNAATSGNISRAPFADQLAALNRAGGGVLRVRTYQLYRTAAFSQTLGFFNGWCLEPLDHGNPDSLLKWLKYGIRYGDGYVLGQLTADPPFDVVPYGPYRAESEGTLNRETLVREAKASGLGKELTCMGYSTYRAGEKVELFEVVTGGWDPGWDTWQARGTPFAVFSFMPTRRSASSIETTEGLYLNYIGVPQKSETAQGFAKCPELAGK